VAGGIVYLAGGCVGAQQCVDGFCFCPAYTTDLQAFDPATGAYSTLPAMPRPRYRHIACAVGASIVYLGGRSLPDDEIIAEVDVYDTLAREWSTLPPPAAYPPPAGDLGSDNSCTTVGDLILVFGGYNAAYNVTFDSTYAFDLRAPQPWTRRAGVLALGRGDFASVALNGLVHVYGGYSCSTPAGCDFCRPLAAHEAYDPTADAWAPRAPLPLPLAEKDDGVVLGGLMYVIGGETKAVPVDCIDTDIVALTGVHEYDPAADAWAAGPPLPAPRMRFATVEAAGAGLAFGGQGWPLVDGVEISLLYSALALAPGAAPAPAPPPSFSGGQVAATAVLSVLLTLAAAGGALACVAARRGAAARLGEGGEGGGEPRWLWPRREWQRGEGGSKGPLSAVAL